MSGERKKKKLKRAKKAARRARDKATVPPGYSTPLLKHFKLGDPFGGLSREQRGELLAQLGRGASRSFAEGLAKLESLLERHNPLELLATASLYTQFTSAGPATDHTKEAPYPQPIAEVLQSLCLRRPRAEFGREPVLHQNMFAALDAAKECSWDFMLKRFEATPHVGPDQRAFHMLIEGARASTQVIRNWGYPQHMRRIVADLSAPLDRAVLAATGLSATEFLAVAQAIQDLIRDRVDDFLGRIGPAFASDNPRDIIRSYCTLANAEPGAEHEVYQLFRANPITKRNLKFFLMSYFHCELPAAFTVTAEDCAKTLPAGRDVGRLTPALDRLSLEFGDLAADDPEHLFMQSRIRARPLVRLGPGEYFVPLPGLLHSFSVEAVESLVLGIPKLKEAYHKRRAAYLEEAVTALVQSAFPGCPVYAGTTGVSPIDDRDYENDCVAVLGPLALVFEAKSERVDDAARRGAGNKLKAQYRTMVGEPAGQGERFARILEGGRGVRAFRTRSGESYELDLSTVRRVVCVSVTLDSFPATSMCWRQLVRAELVEPDARPAVHTSLADLTVLFEVLADPAVALHYFWRRDEWERAVDYLGDELDLLVYYLSEGLAIRPELREAGASFLLLGRSDELHRHYLAAWAGTPNPPPRPRRILTDWWGRVLNRVASRHHPQKWDIACVLLDLSYDRQKEFERRFARTVRSVRLGGNDGVENGFAVWGESSESSGAVVGFAYRGLSKEDRNGRAGNLASQAHDTHPGK